MGKLNAAMRRTSIKPPPIEARTPSSPATESLEQPRPAVATISTHWSPSLVMLAAGQPKIAYSSEIQTPIHETTMPTAVSRTSLLSVGTSASST